MSLTSKNNERSVRSPRHALRIRAVQLLPVTDCQGRSRNVAELPSGAQDAGAPRLRQRQHPGPKTPRTWALSYNALRIRGRVFGGAGLDPEKARTATRPIATPI